MAILSFCPHFLYLILPAYKHPEEYLPQVLLCLPLKQRYVFCNMYDVYSSKIIVFTVPQSFLIVQIIKSCIKLYKYHYFIHCLLQSHYPLFSCTFYHCWFWSLSFISSKTPIHTCLQQGSLLSMFFFFGVSQSRHYQNKYQRLD